MARIRSIKPETWTDPDVVACTPLARLLWIGSWNHADDYGVLKDDPIRLKLQILPADPCDPHALIDELVDRSLLVRRVAPDGTRVLVIRTFCVHQKIDTRATGRWGHPDTFAEPPDTQPSPPVPNRPRQSPTDPASPQPVPTIRTERSGVEGKEQSRAPDPPPKLALIVSNSSSPPATERPPPRYPTDFDAWWSLYPRKVAKATAAKAWKRARGTATWEQLRTGLEASIRAWQAEKRQLEHIPHASTWLDNRRWEDDLQADLERAPARPKSAEALDRVFAETPP